MKTFKVFAEKSNISHHSDIGFVVSFILLAGLGLVTLYVSSANWAVNLNKDSTYFLRRQLISFAIGFVLLLIASLVNLDLVRKALPYFYIITVVLCLLVFIPKIGFEKDNAHRWILIPGWGTFQPSELAKLAVILFLANWFDKKQDKLTEPGFNVGQAVVGLFVFVILIFLQKDFSTACFVMVIGLSMFFIAGIKITWFVGFCIFCLPILVLFIFTETYRVQRLIGFFNPEKYASNMNYQVNLAGNAIASGRFFGKGFGSELKLVTSVPECTSDFVFVGWAEGMGYMGVLVYFLILVFFAYRGYVIAFRCKDKFRSYVAFGIVTSIVLQSILNCGVVCGALPTTGIPLPFFSAGGSSLIVTLLMCGIVINISKFDNESMEPTYE